MIYKNYKDKLVFTKLSDLLISIFWIAIVFYCISSLVYPYLKIKDDSKSELILMTDSIKGTSLEKTFNNNLNYYMNDHLLTNSEFSKLKDLFVDYKISVASGDEAEFIKNKNEDFKKQLINDEKSELFWNEYKKPFFVFIMAFILCIPPYFAVKKFSGF